MEEDCLSLNVYVPSGNRTAPPGGWPIMLFWYGGSWEMGAAGFPLYDADADVQLMEDIIFASSNYRENAMGFLAGDDLRAESPDGSVGNYGLLDQRAALKFLHDNAAGFSGNPDRITIFGESAGAGSVSHHLTMPSSWPYFSAAAMESGPFAPWISRPYNISATQLPQLAANVNCTQATGPARMECLRAVPWQTIVTTGLTNLTRGIITWAPVIDGVTVLDDPRVLAAAGAIAPVPVLLARIRTKARSSCNHSSSALVRLHIS
jgi:carboxylesterase type B